MTSEIRKELDVIKDMIKLFRINFLEKMAIYINEIDPLNESTISPFVDSIAI